MRNFIATLLFFLCSFFSVSTFATTYYVSSSTGNDNNSGTDPSSAWQSINKVNSVSLKPGDNVLFMRGDSFYGGLIVTNSGNSANPITYSAYGSGAKPIITGFTNITSWTNLGGNIWESTNAVSTLPTAGMVSVNGVNTAMGRYPNSTGPNTGYITIASHSGSFSITATGGLGSTNWTGAGIVIRKQRWAMESGTITSQSGNTLNFQDPNVDDPQDGFGFFIQNDPRTLDVNGEWYYNPSTHKLRIYSTSSPSNVQIATIENLVSIDVKSYVVFDNLAIKGSNSAGINCLEYGGNNLTIQNCDVSFAGQQGIVSLENNSTIQNNTVNYANSLGIYTSQPNCLIQNNTIKNINMLEGMGANVVSPGIQNYGANSVIKNNVLDSLGYMGISFSGLNVSVKNNFVSNICFIKDDGGGICMGGRSLGEGSVIDGNIVLNAIGAPQGSVGNAFTDASGIMIDGYGTGITVINNTTANCANSGIKLLEDQRIIVNNNTCYNNGLNYSWATGGIQLLSGSDLAIRNITMQGNIFVARTASQIALFAYGASGSTADLLQFGTFDNNYYAKPIDQSTAILANSNPYSIAGWQSYSGQDAHSLGSPKAITDTNDLIFEYNASSSPKTISLNANYIDVKNVSYNGSITLQPYMSAVLIRNGAKTSNQPPVASVGPDQTINLPQSSIVLPGSGTDPDGSVVAYSWTQISGPSSATITNATSAQAGASNLIAGNYVFALQVTDNQGATGTANLNVTVQNLSLPSTPTSVPVVNVGSDRVITLPQNSIVLPGSATDANGSIVSYAWSQVSGPSTANLTNSTSAQAGAGNLVAGNYQFQLQVTDDQGATASSVLNVTVNSANVTNNLTVNVGSDRVIQLPKNSIVLPGSASDANGNIVSYSWSQISGPSSATMINPTSAYGGAGNMVVGNYQFQLSVTDDQGSTGAALLNVTVNPANSSTIAVNVGADRQIQLPKNSIVLPGSASDPNGNIVSYSWTQISGPSSATMVNPSSAQAGAGNMIAGNYQFQLTVTDDQGSTGTAMLNVEVNPAGTNNISVNVGSDRVIQLPKNSIVLPGSASDANGNIVSYAWTQISGPSTATMVNPSSAKAGAGDMIAGDYQFQLTVTDDQGVTGSSILNVTVDGSNQARIAAGNTNAISNTSLKGDSATAVLNSNSVMLGAPTVLPVATSLSVYPNPAVNSVNLQIQSPNNYSNAVIIITDMNGRAVSKKIISITPGSSTQQIDVSGLGKGTYIITVNFDGTQIQSTKLVKL